PRLQPHPARRVDHLGIDLAHPDVRVRQDRWDRKQHERKHHVGEADADIGDEERDQRQARDGPAHIREADRQQLAFADMTEHEPDRDRDGAGDADLRAAQLDVLPGEFEDLVQAADLDAARLRLARMEDEVDRVREIREETERRMDHAGLALRHGVSRRCAVSRMTSSVNASRTVRPPAATTPVLNVMLLPAMISLPSPPAPANTASVARPTVLVEAIRRPATMSGRAS